jgi:hypothetical protein
MVLELLSPLAFFPCFALAGDSIRKALSVAIGDMILGESHVVVLKKPTTYW